MWATHVLVRVDAASLVVVLALFGLIMHIDSLPRDLRMLRPYSVSLEVPLVSRGTNVRFCQVKGHLSQGVPY